MNKPLLYKLLGIAFLSMLLMIPLIMVEEQIMTRSSYQEQVKGEISQSAAGEQTLVGPVLAIRYRIKIPPVRVRDEKTGKLLTTHPAKQQTHILKRPADQLNITGKASVERRYRGIYQARLYHMDMKLDGSFTVPADLGLPPQSEGELIDAHAVLLLGITDLRGMNNDPEVQINAQAMHFQTPKDETFNSILAGNRLEMDLGPVSPGQARTFNFAFPMNLTGTERFSITPTASSNNIKLTSNWPDPSFQGRFLPQERNIDAQGFEANWAVSGLARNFERALQANGGVGFNPEALSINFLDTVNIYLHSERAVKYGSLFIVLTFAAFFLVEILRRQPIHVMQYLLVGLALTIFFLLLIALSEHLAFLYAYLIASFACIGLIIFYLSGALGGIRPAMAFGAGFVGLYGVLYGILQSEDNALLMGSLLLFVVLAAIMAGTRHLDWYHLSSSKNA
ncbi:MAG: cell envelope integrity protein CreD [Zoogloeaceae bacterium]|nr:cell envelope integrity protein CreD [Zoogloeaceae bacterium]